MAEGRASAKIYPFPPRPRAAGGRIRGSGSLAAEPRPSPYPVVDCGSGWYHEAAMQDDQRRKS